MARRIDNDVMLGHKDARDVARLLSDYATDVANHARRTKCASIRAYCMDTAAQARGFAELITRALYTWVEVSSAWTPYEAQADSAQGRAKHDRAH